jgi:hypothetical protein
MVLIFGAGLWAILQFGHLLHAPPDLAGEWETIGTSPAKLTIQQSGRFLVLMRDGEPRIDVKIVDQQMLDSETPPRARLTMTERGWTVIADGPPRGDVYHFDVRGPSARDSFDARRTKRLYPTRDSQIAATQPTSAPSHARP